MAKTPQVNGRLGTPFGLNTMVSGNTAWSYGLRGRVHGNKYLYA